MTTRIDSLRSLQNRIRNSSGADIQIDALLDCVRYNREFIRWGGGTGIAEYIFKGHRGFEDVSCARTPYTASLDACVGLLEAAFPGKKWSKSGETGMFFIVGIVHAQKLATDCLTFLDAILSAKISELEAKTEKTT